MPKKPSFQDSSFTENVRFYASRSSYSSNNHMECVAAFVLKESLKKWAILECCCVVSFPSNFQRDYLFEEMLQEPHEVATKRKRTRETLRVLQLAFRTLDELPLEAESVERGYSFSNDTTGLPKIHGLPTSSIYNSGGGSTELYGASPKHSKSRRSSNSGELHLPYYPDTNGGGRNSMPGLYPTGEF